MVLRRLTDFPSEGSRVRKADPGLDITARPLKRFAWWHGPTLALFNNVGCRNQFALLIAMAVSARASPILIGKSMSHTLRQPHMIRAAVANSKLLKIRAVGRDRLLLTGMRLGTTMVRIWTADGNELAHIIKIIDPEIALRPTRIPNEGVVKVSMEFIEFDLALANELGIRWPGSIELSSAGFIQGSLNTSGLNYSASILPAKMLLKFLREKGLAKTFANPVLSVRLGELATFHAGGEVPIPTGSQSFGHYHKKIEWKSHGLSVQVRPTSEDGYRIRSDVKIDIAELSRETSIDGIPGFNRRKIETKMESVDGGTAVLSALLKQTRSEKREGLPLLASIPILGYLFSSDHNQSSETELIVAITFSILNSAREQEYLDRLRRKLHD